MEICVFASDRAGGDLLGSSRTEVQIVRRRLPRPLHRGLLPTHPKASIPHTQAGSQGRPVVPQATGLSHFWAASQTMPAYLPENARESAVIATMVSGDSRIEIPKNAYLAEDKAGETGSRIFKICVLATYGSDSPSLGYCH